MSGYGCRTGGEEEGGGLEPGLCGEEVGHFPPKVLFVGFWEINVRNCIMN